MKDADGALVELGRLLKRESYQFITVTPETHQRVNGRPGNEEARSVRDVLGWSRPFRRDVLSPGLFELLAAAGALIPDGERLRSKVRFSSVGELLLAHSAFPTVEKDSVFLGPDTYRFVSLLRRKVRLARRAVDLGCGTGAGGLSVASRAQRWTLTDISANALRFSRINAQLAGVDVEVLTSDVLRQVAGPVDLVIANPPYLVDGEQRVYRDGGGELGTGLAVRIVQDALERLEKSGTVMVYTGTPIVRGEDVFFRALRETLGQSHVAYEYEELDPDVFGEELSRAPYQDVDRIAAVSLIATKS